MTISSVSGLFSSATLFGTLDSNSDGKVSKDEFVNGRPKDVSESQASALFDTIDSSGSGSLTESRLSQGLAQNTPTGDAANLQGTNLSSDIVGALIAFLQGEQTSDGSTSAADATTTAAASTPHDPAAEFAKLDTDGDGTVSEAEFVAGRPSGVSEDDAKALFSKLDPNGTGSITEAQFQGGTQQAHAGGAHHHHHGGGGGGIDDLMSDLDSSEDTVFNALDTDHDGVVSAAEYAAGAPKVMSSDSVNSLFSSIDTDQSGGVSLDEFKAHINGTDSATSTSPTATSTASSDADSSSGNTISTDTSANAQFAVENFLQQLLGAVNAYNSTYSNANLQSSLLGISA